MLNVYDMAEVVTLDKSYQELKMVEQRMVTKEEVERIIETIEIMSNENTMEKIRQSE